MPPACCVRNPGWCTVGIARARWDVGHCGSPAPSRGVDPGVSSTVLPWWRKILPGVLLLLTSAPALAQEAWLVTYGPGGDAWSRFGHNAVMIRDDERGIEINYAFGYFDMNRPGFLTDFLQGILIYEGHATRSQRELAYYRDQDRSVRKQRLNLSPDEVERFHELLQYHVRPENRTYEYDYYYNNCSTRIRDLLDKAMGGGLRSAMEERPARLNLRDHTHRLSQNDFWLHTGLMLVLGPGVDGERNAWEEMFLPMAMADQLAEFERAGEPLVTEDFHWYESAAHGAPRDPGHRLFSYALAGVLTAAFLLVPAWRLSGRMRWLPLQALAMVSALAGTGLLLLWFASNHDAIWRNAVLLLLNPLWLLALWRRPPLPPRGIIAVLGLLTVAGAIVLAWPEGYQYRPGPLLWLVPANLAALAALWWRWTTASGERGGYQ